MSYYLELTKDLRTNDHLIVHFKKPPQAVSTSTISRRCKTIPGKTDIGIEKCLSYFTRSASASKTKIRGLSLSEINNERQANIQKIWSYKLTENSL